MAKETDSDPFEDLLDLENKFYQEGYALGFADGARAGQIEGRVFGMEKGFEKMRDMGRLNGRAAVWNARMLKQTDGHDSKLEAPAIRDSERLRKHVGRLKELSDTTTISTENSEDAVAEFDERFKDASTKGTLISKIVGEDAVARPTAAGMPVMSSKTGSKGLRVKQGETAKQTGEMEDFAGLPGTRKQSAH